MNLIDIKQNSQNYIDLAIEIHNLHRYVFNNVYVSGKHNLSTEEELKLNQYKSLELSLPYWRDILKLEYLCTNDANLKEILALKDNGMTRYGNINEFVTDYYI